jgi:hypothetical protein
MVDHLKAHRERFLELIEKWHAGHPRPDQVPHCVNVSRLLEEALDREPAPVALRREMILAALGHDLYEDTKIKRADVLADYGSDVDRLIEAVTERSSVAEFVERVASGPEEPRLIKLADGIDNYGGHIGKGLLRVDPATWVEIVRKKMEPMFSRIAGVPFRQYTAAGSSLARQLEAEREAFWREVGVILRGRPQPGAAAERPRD